MTAPPDTKGNVDWEALRARLDATRAAFQHANSDALDETAARAVLQRRAALLAKRAVIDDEGDVRSMITFRLGAEGWAIDATLVLHVFRLHSLALLPGAAPPIHGVTMWRGQVLTLLDFRSLLGISMNALNDLGRVIVVGRSRAVFGFVVDSVTGARNINLEELDAASGQTARRHPLVRGITSDALLVLDGDAVLGLGDSGGPA